eukprot:5959865-Prymnesium_polylepis.1
MPRANPDAPLPRASPLPDAPSERGAADTMKLGPDGTLIKLPKSALRQKFPAVGYTASAASLAAHRTTALSDDGFGLLEALLTCDPERRASARGALESAWFSEAPLPVRAAGARGVRA